MRLFLVHLIGLGLLHAGVTSVNIVPPSYKELASKKLEQHIKILDQKQLSFSKISDMKFAELSDLTYDLKTKTLYMVSDKGFLYAFNAQFSKTIDMLVPMSAKKLSNKKGKRLRKWNRDSEGLTLDGKGRLLISFEGKAKIGWFHKNSKSYGNLIRKYELPKALKKTENYRSKNKSLESLAWHPKYGILTATEWPLKKDHKKTQTIYALSGKKWHFKAEPEGRSGLVAMEVMGNGDILVLERSYTGMLNPLVVTLKRVSLKNCLNQMCQSEVLLKMNNHKGWEVDNFEGLARVGKNRYVMISDDGDNVFQRTLLIYFEVID